MLYSISHIPRTSVFAKRLRTALNAVETIGAPSKRVEVATTWLDERAFQKRQRLVVVVTVEDLELHLSMRKRDGRWIVVDTREEGGLPEDDLFPKHRFPKLDDSVPLVAGLIVRRLSHHFKFDAMPIPAPKRTGSDWPVGAIMDEAVCKGTEMADGK